MKSIYNFTVNMVREVEEKSTEKRKNKETGKEEEIEVSKKVEKKIPYDIILKQPNRRQLEDADMEYSIEISRCIKKGILTKAMLAKKYSDTGGILTEKDAERLVDLYGELSEFESEASKLGINTSGAPQKKMSKKAKEMNGQIAMTRRDIVNLESSYQSLFNHTADIKSQNRVILWYILHLSHYQTSDMEKPELVFQGEDFEGKVDDYYGKDEKDDKLFRLIQSKLAAIVSYWYFSATPTREEFDKLISELHTEDNG
jgi:membrane-associated HD superfamily phosphohydrolase